MKVIFKGIYIETAVDDRRHDPIEHLVVAMSVPDLLSKN